MNWLGRLRSSLGGVLFGGLLVLVGFPLLFWNEGRAVKTAKSLQEGVRSVVSIEPGQVDPSHEGALVHVVGEARPIQPLTDSQLGVTELAIRFDRTVEMFQWKENEETETRDSADGKKEQVTKYTYEKVWSSTPIDSSQFHEAQVPANPDRFPFSSLTSWADEVRLGAFRLSDSQVKRISGSSPYAVAPETVSGLPEPFAKFATVQDGHLYFPATALSGISSTPSGSDPIDRSDEVDELIKGVTEDQSGIDPPAKESQDPARLARDPEVDALIEGVDDSVNPADTPAKSDGVEVADEDSKLPALTAPAIGDVRVRMEVIKPQEISIIARQSGDSFEPFRTKAGRELSMLSAGSVSADKMFEQAISANRFFTWVLRLVGFVVMLVGVLLVFRPLSVVADAVPLVGGLLQFGVFFVALVIAAPLALATIAIAWIFYRPLFALGLLALAVGIVVAVVFLVRALRGKEDPSQHLGAT